jgi:hypothetical protein
MDIGVENIPGSYHPEAAAPSMQADSVQHMAIAKRFNIDIPTKEEEGKLKEVWNYARKLSESSDIPDVIWQIVHLEGVLGAPRLGESRLDRLYRYAKLRRQEAQIQEELKSVALGSHL